MKALVISAPEQAKLSKIEQPQIGPEEVLIRSRAVGICGSDVELYRGIRPSGYYRYPVIPGHEWAGEVVAVGERVHTIKPGDRVVAEGFLFCGTCRNCRVGLTNLCEAGYDEIGFTRPGGMAEYVAVPARLVHVLPPDASFEQAALLEPTAVVAHGFLRVQPLPGDTVVIVGDGTIGLLAVQIARLFSPAHLVLLGSREERLHMGKQLGATHTFNARANDPQAFIDTLTGGQGADLVFEGGNRPAGVEQAFQLARRGGTVILEGIAGAGAHLNVESDIFVLKHLAVFGIFGANSAAWDYAVRMFSAGLLQLAPLISHRFPLGEYQRARYARQPPTRYIESSAGSRKREAIVDTTRRFLEQMGLPPTDLHDLPSSNKRFPDGAQYRVEIPSTESPAALAAILEEAQRYGLTIHRVSEGSGVMLLTDEEIQEMASLARNEGMEISLFARPNAAWDTGAMAVASAGKAVGPRLRGEDQLVYCLEDVQRAATLGIRSVLLADEGALWVAGEMRKAGILPKDMQFKISVMMASANPASIRLMENLGANTYNIPTDLTLAQIAAIRQAVDIPLDIYVEVPDDLGGFVRLYEIPELVRIAAPVYIKFGLRNAPNIYPVGKHIESLSIALSRERVRRAKLGLDLLQRYYPDAIQSKAGAPGLAIPAPRKGNENH